MRWILLIPAIFSTSFSIAQEYAVNPHSLNTAYADEYAPVIAPEGNLYFLSNRKSGLLATVKSSHGGYAPQAWLYAGKTQLPPFSQPDFVAGLAFFPDKNRILVKPQADGSKNFGLYFYKEKEGLEIPFEYNSREYSINQPSLSVSGDTLFFASDMPGGKGGSDIYMSRRENNGWTKPENLHAINSAAMEIFPVAGPGGALTFSSNRDGDYDVYASSPEGSMLKKYPAPINTGSNELSLLWTTELEGYLVSDRQGTDDIFKVRDVFPRCTEPLPVQTVELCYTFFEESVMASDSFPLRYEWVIDEKRYRMDEVTHCFPGPGAYQVDLNIIDTLTGEVYFQEATFSHEIIPLEQVYLSKNEKGLSIDSTYTVLSGIQSPRFFLNYSGQNHEITMGETAAINEEDVVITVTGKTDGNRDTVVCFRQNEFRDAGRGTKKASEPFALNKEKPAAKISEQGEEKVYRVELEQRETRIDQTDEYFAFLPRGLKAEEWFLPDDSVYSYTVGQAERPDLLYLVYQQLKSSGVTSSKIQSFEPERILSLDDIHGESSLNNTTLRASNIYFESGSAQVTGNSSEVLDKLATLLNSRPEIFVEIGAHTDNEGSTASNQALSEKRAQSILNYLGGKGVDRTKLKAYGYGETRPVATNDTQDGRALNRRIEFRLKQNH